ncbi:hypothetical protein DPV78_011928 [Talaromyces pinophilus]|nr:hypothetical protein DPV78_011928 [Talaromyces pinophilus]
MVCALSFFIPGFIQFKLSFFTQHYHITFKEVLFFNQKLFCDFALYFVHDCIIHCLHRLWLIRLYIQGSDRHLLNINLQLNTSSSTPTINQPSQWAEEVTTFPAAATRQLRHRLAIGLCSQAEADTMALKKTTDKTNRIV